MNTSPTPLTFAQRLALIVGGLCQAVAACGGRQMVGFDWRWHDPAIVPLVVPIWGRLKRALARFEALMARYRAGRPMAPRARPGRARPGRVAPRSAGIAVALCLARAPAAGSIFLWRPVANHDG